MTDTIHADDLALLRALVIVARASGGVSPLERAYIERVLRVMRVPKAQRREVRIRLFQEPGSTDPSIWTWPFEYAGRMRIFRAAVEVAFVSGGLDEAEREVLGLLADQMEIEADDEDEVWDGAWERHLGGG